MRRRAASLFISLTCLHLVVARSIFCAVPDGLASNIANPNTANTISFFIVGSVLFASFPGCGSSRRKSSIFAAKDVGEPAEVAVVCIAGIREDREVAPLVRLAFQRHQVERIDQLGGGV